MPMVAKPITVETRQRLFQHLHERPYGYIASYSELQLVLGSDPQTDRTHIYWVGKVLEREAQRTLECVRGVGYRVAEPKDHIRLAQRQRKFASRRLRRAQSISTSTNRTVLTPEEAKRLTDLEIHLSRVQQVLGGHGRRLEQVEAVVENGAAKQADLEARLSRLEQALRGQAAASVS